MGEWGIKKNRAVGGKGRGGSRARNFVRAWVSVATGVEGYIYYKGRKREEEKVFHKEVGRGGSALS